MRFSAPKVALGTALLFAACSDAQGPSAPGVSGAGAGGMSAGGGAAGASGGSNVAGAVGVAGSGGVAGGMAVGGAAGMSNDAAGAGGMGGTGGTGGMGGMSTAGAGTGGGSSVLPDGVPSQGCGTAAAQALEMFVQHDTQVGEFERSYFVRLPAGYDPARAYPLLIVGPGCGGSGDNAIPVQTAAGADAIVVGLNISAEVAGRDCFMTESDMSPELDYFDVMWAEVSAAYCIDTSRVLYGGFSSGSWLANLLGCARSDVLRAQGNVAGGPPPIPACRGPVAALMIHDANDNSNGIDGGRTARGRILEQNGCTGEETAAWDPEYPMCLSYTGCPVEFPVVWCETSGVGHDPQNDLSAPLFWKFLTSLPSEPVGIVPAGQ